MTDCYCIRLYTCKIATNVCSCKTLKYYTCLHSCVSQAPVTSCAGTFGLNHIPRIHGPTSDTVDTHSYTHTRARVHTLINKGSCGRKCEGGKVPHQDNNNNSRSAASDSCSHEGSPLCQINKASSLSLCQTHRSGQWTHLTERDVRNLPPR